MLKILNRFLWIIFIVSSFIFLFSFPDDSSGAADLIIYDDTLASGWQDWSWDTTRSFAATSPVHGGAYSISVTYDAKWAGLYLHADPAVDLSNYVKLSFWIHGGSAGGQQLRVVADQDGSNIFAVTAQAGTWTQITVPLSALGSPASLSDLYWQSTLDAAQPTFYLDDVKLIARTGPPPPPGTGPDLTINAGAGRRLISEDIYGINLADEQLAAELRLPVRRWGGNSTSRYNWQTNMHNTGSDWYFENLSDGPGVENGSATDLFVEQDRRTVTKTLLTMPLIGWTPRSDSPRDHPLDCGFKVSRYGPQIPPNAWTAAVDPWDTDCGSGVKAGPMNVTGNDPADTSVPIGTDFVAAWINHLTGKYGSASNGGVAYYNLDNEPMLWNSTHRDVHPLPATYDEVRDRTYQYASVVKAADPSAKTLGPVLWGWCAYFYSALDGCAVGNDYQTHGNTPFVPWYLQQMKSYEQQHGMRILDYLDLHYYPAASGVSLSSAGNTATQALRLRSTRSLWDQSYIDESWISDLGQGGIAVGLIPRMKKWVNSNYPGTKMAITEYNWGGLESINGALAQADVLGIFGREGLDLATLWSPPDSTQPGAFAFRIYRNYDAAGHGFGDISIQAVSADQGTLSVYAAERSMDNALTVIVINKTSGSLTSIMNLTGFSPAASAVAYRYSPSALSSIEHLSDQPVSPGGFTATFPGNSITLFAIMPECSNSRVRFGNDPAYTDDTSIQHAYGNSQDGQVIQARAVDFVENLDLSRPVSVHIQGGYDCNYAGNNGYTTIHGTVTLRGDAVTIDNLSIQ